MNARGLVAVLIGCAPAGSSATVSTAELVVVAPPPGGAAVDLVVMNLDGTGRVQLTHDAAVEFLPHFAPDATRVVYTKFAHGTYGDADALTDIALYDFTTAAETLLTDRGDAAQAAWSPDGVAIAFLVHPRVTGASELWLMDADGANQHRVAAASGAGDDAVWGDIAWSSDDWIVLVVGEQPAGPCFKARLDKLRRDGTERTKVSDGGASCTPPHMEQSGDADPGISADGRTIYTSRGLPVSPPGAVTPPGSPTLVTERRLVALSSEPWTVGKSETDLSLTSAPDCIEGVPKAAPDGQRVLVFRACFGPGAAPPGVYLADTAGTSRTFVCDGFGADWNPTR